MKGFLKTIFCITLSACICIVVTAKNANAIENFSQQDLNRESILALNWFQTSAEYRALAYQSYAVARLTLDKILELEIENPAIVMDLDETVLDNSPYYAAMVGNNTKDTIELWNQWVKSEQAEAIPGAIEFIEYVANNTNVRIFFISNRYEKYPCDSQVQDLEIATIDNLKKIGVREVSDENVILKCEFADGDNRSKTLRKKAVINGNADGIEHTIILSIGDNMKDFSENVDDSIEARKEFIDNNKSRFGRLSYSNNLPAFIVLPNPFYGSWESTLYEARKLDKNELTPLQKNIDRLNALEIKSF